MPGAEALLAPPVQDLYSNDGCTIPAIYRFLWEMPSNGSSNQSVHLPHTVREAEQPPRAALARCLSGG